MISGVKLSRVLAVAAALGGCGTRISRVPLVDPEFIRRYAPPGPPGDPWGSFVRDSVAEYGVRAPLIYAVMRAESRGCQWLNGHPMRELSGEVGRCKSRRRSTT